jgi:muramoyltetrapeptide carboxypeptidase
MNRKHFISSFVAAGAVLSVSASQAAPLFKQKKTKHQLPPFLQAGDTVAITSPASYISLEQIRPAIQLMESWGYKVIVGTATGKKDFTYGGTDAERVVDLQRLLDDPSVKAIMCARGGYGLVRIIDRLDFKQFVKHPKWIIGFSDVTVLHCHIQKKYGIATLHSKMCNSFPDDWLQADPVQLSTILSIRQALAGEDFKYTVPHNPANRAGRGEGHLVGGNLSMVATLSGTTSALDTKGKILFLEDVNERAYSIDRMFWNLKRTGALADLAGLVIGGFSMKADEPGDEFGQTIHEIVMEKVREYTYPVCFDFPVGHQRNNVALRCGAEHILDVGGNGSVLWTI